MSWSHRGPSWDHAAAVLGPSWLLLIARLGEWSEEGLRGSEEARRRVGRESADGRRRRFGGDQRRLGRGSGEGMRGSEETQRRVGGGSEEAWRMV